MDLGLGSTFNYIETVGGIARYRLMLTRRVTRQIGLSDRITFDALVDENSSTRTIVVIREGETLDGIVTRGVAKTRLKELSVGDPTVTDDGIILPDAFVEITDTESVANYVVQRAPRFIAQLGLTAQA